MKDYTNIKATLKKHHESLDELKNHKVIQNKKDFTSQIGEWFVSELYGGTRAQSGIQKDWDIIVSESYIQVKTHSKAITTKARWSVIKKNYDAKINVLIIVVFTENYKLREFYKLPWEDAYRLITSQKSRDVIHWDHLNKYKINIEELPNQSVVSLFK
ncbi:MAG: hypothetical protein CFE24_15065 [Flavobacterium sp. BFFFF2]|nr:MAG: hypothetical protein CFE24_15065 [Flavobacterium sp. BFFFF2]